MVAIESLLAQIKENRSNNCHTLVILLDIANAFNAAWRPAILQEMERVKCSSNILNLANDFLQGRRIVSEEVERQTERGCPQGSSMGPILWLVLMEGWFRAMSECGSNVHVQAYADDQVVVIRGESIKKMENTWYSVWDKCVQWAKISKLEYSLEKTEAMFIPGKSKLLSKPRVKLEGTVLELKESIKYLGVTIDVGMKWVEHVRLARGKATGLARNMAIVAGKRWGASDEMKRMVYANAIVPIIMYGAEVWGEKAGGVFIKRHLCAAQRPFLLNILGAFRTTPNTALWTFCGVPPLWVVAWAKFSVRQTNKARVCAYEVNPCSTLSLDSRERVMEHIGGECLEDEDNIILVDTCKTEQGVGAAGVLMNLSSDSIEEECLRLNSDTAINRAEEVAIWLGCTMAQKANIAATVVSDAEGVVQRIKAFKPTSREHMDIQNILWGAIQGGRTIKVRRCERRDEVRSADILSRKAVSMESMCERGGSKREVRRLEQQLVTRRWQELWDSAETGRAVHRTFPKVSTGRTGVSSKTVQLVSGHGYFGAYFKRFNLRQGPGTCACGLAEETAEHIWWQCEMEERVEARQRFRATLSLREDDVNLGEVNLKSLVRALNELAEVIVKTDMRWEGR